MAVCLATTTGDTGDDDHVVELVREDDEVCLLDSAIITSYSPLTFNLQLNARSNFRGWLESRLNSPAADIYLARCSKRRSCDRCILASQITCAESNSPPRNVHGANHGREQARPFDSRNRPRRS